MALTVLPDTNMKVALALVVLGGSLVSLVNPLSAQITEPAGPYQAITAGQRFEWFAKSTVGPASLLGGTFSAGFGTLVNRPPEYGTHWDGFGQRYGMRMTGIATGNAMEATMGALWGEDPRYPRKGHEYGLGKRVGHVVKWTFMAYRSDGSVAPAYARFGGIVGNNFLSNSWRAPSEADNEHAYIRIGEGFLGKMAGNAWDEFWPDVKGRIFRH
jgi:hypothetical protein